MQNLKITKDLIFDYSDLMREIDVSHEFTLDAILKICQNSKIPQDILCQILRCNHIFDLCKEADSKPFEDDGNIENLRLHYTMDISEYKSEITCVDSWIFDGVGRAGCYDSKIEEFIKEEDRKTYREHYAVEYSPVYKLKDYMIKIEKGIKVLDWRKENAEFEKGWTEEVTPSITLQTLLYSIFWELTWCGSPEERDSSLEYLKGVVGEIENVDTTDNSKYVDIDDLKSGLDKEG